MYLFYNVEFMNYYIMWGNLYFNIIIEYYNGYLFVIDIVGFRYFEIKKIILII